MKNTFKKAFTIVELVIVIAVIAILAAVLIPTFSNLIEKANISNDTALVKNINTALVVDSVGNNKEAKNMTEALDSASELGFTVEKLTPRSSGDIVWDQVNNKFALLDKDGNFVFADEKTKSVEDHQLWVIVDIAKYKSITNKKYSYYLKGTELLDNIDNLETGLDVGKNYAQQITYKGGKNVIIRTNGDDCVLTVDNSSATVHHYGFAKEVEVKNCDANCYYLYGSVTTLKLGAGAQKVVIEKSAVVFALSLSVGVSFDSTKMKIENSGVVLQAEDSLKTGANISSSTDYEIDSAEKLGFFRDAVNSGADFEGVKVVLTKDITLEGAWTPIGVGARRSGDKTDPYSGNAFKGTFDGQGHTISGLTNTGYISTATYYATKHKVDTFAYGLFGLVDNATIQNLKLSNVSIDAISHTYSESETTKTLKGDSVGAIVGFCGGGLTMKNCEVVSGTVNGFDAVGGLVGRIYDQNGNKQPDTVTIDSCINRASVSGDIKVAGILGYTNITDNNKYDCTISNCSNYGEVKLIDGAGYLAGIFGFGGSNNTAKEIKYTIKNNNNQGILVFSGDYNTIYASKIATNCGDEINANSSVIAEGNASIDITIENVQLNLVTKVQVGVKAGDYKRHEAQK